MGVREAGQVDRRSQPNNTARLFWRLHPELPLQPFPCTQPCTACSVRKCSATGPVGPAGLCQRGMGTRTHLCPWRRCLQGSHSKAICHLSHAPWLAWPDNRLQAVRSAVGLLQGAVGQGSVPRLHRRDRCRVRRGGGPGAGGRHGRRLLLRAGRHGRGLVLPGSGGGQRDGHAGGVHGGGRGVLLRVLRELLRRAQAGPWPAADGGRGIDSGGDRGVGQRLEGASEALACRTRQGVGKLTSGSKAAGAPLGSGAVRPCRCNSFSSSGMAD